MSRIEYLAEIDAWNPGTASVVTLRYSSLGKVTGPAETPANTEYAPRLTEPGDFKRSIMEVAARGVRPQVTIGDVLLINTDGALDGLTEYGFDGRALTIRLGVEGAAYPSGYPIIFAGTMEDAEVTRERARIRLRDNATLLSVPLQTSTYAGTNTLPDGLEGVEGDLKGKPKPFLLGRVRNIAPPCVNTAKLIYQVNDGAVASIDNVYDKGHSLGHSPNGWTSIAHGEGAFEGRGAAASASALLLCGFGGGPNTKVLRTTDGVAFDDVTGGAMVGARAEDIAYGVGVHVLIEWDSPDIKIWTSANNGTSWTERSLPVSWVNTITAAFSVRWHEAQEVFVITAMTGAIATSPTGETWTARASGVVVALWDSASDGTRIGIAGGDSGGGGGIVLESLDAGATWDDLDLGLTSADAQALSIGAARDTWVVGTDGGKLLTSPDFRQWTVRPSPNSTGVGVFSILNGAGWWLAGHGAGIAMSESAESWRGATTIGGLFPVTFGLAAFDGRFWGVGATPTGVIAAESPIEYADLTELADDAEAPEPGNFGWVSHADGSYIRLGSPPAGLITADVTQGATAADRTAGSLFENVLTKHGLTSTAWSTADVTALDSADNGEQGLYVSENETPTVEEAIDRIAASVGAWWTTDAAGLYRIARLLAPSGTPVLTLTENDVIGLERLASERPSYRTTLRYARHYVVQSNDLALGVSDARRAALSKEFREAFDEDAAVQTAHPLAVATVEESLYADAADAEAEATRRQTLRGVKRHRYQLTCALTTATEALALGNTISLIYPRFGLDAGALCRVLAIEPRRAAHRIVLHLWR